MRLIDADKLLSHLNDYALQEAPGYGRTQNALVYEAIKNCMAAVEDQETYDTGWIPAAEAMPDEHDSVFEKLRKKNKLPKELLRMHKQESDSVIVTVEFEDGSKAVMTAKTKDGKWDTGYKIEGQTVIAWMPFPEPWECG